MTTIKLYTFFLGCGLKAVINAILSSVGVLMHTATSEDEDIEESSLKLIESICATIESSQWTKEIGIQNEINNLTDNN